MRLKSNLPFTAKRDYSQNIKAHLIAVYFNSYKGRTSLIFISKCSGDIILSYMEAFAIFCTRMDFTNIFCNVIRFPENQIYRKHVHGDGIQDGLSPQLLYFDLFLMKQYIRINPDV